MAQIQEISVEIVVPHITYDMLYSSSTNFISVVFIIGFDRRCYCTAHKIRRTFVPLIVIGK